ncbi:helix-turn-helix transcriptional regulator [Marinobacter sp. BGYM27]|uniref:helix-turn-helix domain-containing protein n=1 Tax=Marinobacter sp. BGYM27 TaxID=2975597 RepID=UPI0021A97535|nr:helix-turn-helix transcriptional regulator [Marinobacter sp. BGYM27]MDG5498436.1 helix-turn-helix transcriptional regulator [Marinobacter sp. BGYM27]
MSAGQLLAEYRRARRMSQLDLGLQASVSTRHVSFVETGRASPSRDMLMRLADVLDLPHRETNMLLTAGGFTPAYSDADLSSPEMKTIRDALMVMLRNQEPFPATVVDGSWNILMGNRVHSALLDAIVPEQKRQGRLNVLELLFDPQAFRPLVTNWEMLASWMLRRLRRQLTAFPDESMRRLLSRLLAMDPPANWQQPNEDGIEGPMITFDMAIGGQRLSLFSTLSRFGTALDVGAQELLVESYFPVDDATRQFFHGFAKSSGIECA